MYILRVGLLGRAPVVSLSSSSFAFHFQRHRTQTRALAHKMHNMGGYVGTQVYGFNEDRRTMMHAKIATQQFSTSLSSIASAPSLPQAALATPSKQTADTERAQPTKLEQTNLPNNHKEPTFFSGYRKILKVREKSTKHLRNTEEMVKNQKGHMTGYKYRLLATPQLTNHVISPPEPTLERSPAASDVPTSSQISEKEIFDIRLLQQQYAIDVDRGGSSQHTLTGMSDIPSLRWLRSLLNDLGYAPTEFSSAPHYSHPTSQLSMRSRRSSSIALEEMMNSDSYTGSLPDERQNPDDEEEISDRIRVRSVQAASAIDVVAVLSKVFGGGVARTSQYTSQHPLSDFFASSPPIRHVFGRTNIIIQLSSPPTNGHPSLAHSVPRYIAIYRFGAVVFFNLTTKEASRVLEQVKKHAVNPISVGFERREHFEVALQPQLETATGKITADRAMVRELDMNTVGIVSNIMGQTVALDWHNDTVDELLAKFSNVNSSVEKTGSFTSIERNTLFQVVARNNSLFIDMVGKLGIKDRSDTAWHLSQYEGLHEGMRKEFELDERFRVSIEYWSWCLYMILPSFLQTHLISFCTFDIQNHVPCGDNHVERRIQA